jgi:hypothetical protein
VLSRLPQKLRYEVFQSRTKRQIYDSRLASPQSQYFPREIGNIRDVHLLDNPARLYLFVERVPDAIKLRFGLSHQKRRFPQHR